MGSTYLLRSKWIHFRKCIKCSSPAFSDLFQSGEFLMGAGRDEKGCLLSTKKKAVVDVDHYFYLIDVDHPAFFNLVEVDHCLFHGRRRPVEKSRMVDFDQLKRPGWSTSIALFMVKTARFMSYCMIKNII